MLNKIFWLNFWNTIGLPNQNSMQALSNLESHYKEKERFYHNSNHINECIHQWEQIKDKTQNPYSILLAIYFHDVIYNPTSQTNEEDSIKYMHHFFKSYTLNSYLKKQIHLAENMILLTKQHGVNLKNLSLDEKYMLDIDMSILGQSYSRFIEYEGQIRNEYKMFDDEIFYKHRKKFLETCLNNTLFFTSYYQKYLEPSAKRNINNILKNEHYLEKILIKNELKI